MAGFRITTIKFIELGKVIKIFRICYEYIFSSIVSTTMIVNFGFKNKYFEYSLINLS